MLCGNSRMGGFHCWGGGEDELCWHITTVAHHRSYDAISESWWKVIRPLRYGLRIDADGVRRSAYCAAEKFDCLRFPHVRRLAR